MHIFADYGLFAAKVFTLVIAILLLIAGIVAIANKGKEKGKIKIKRLNLQYEEIRSTIQQEVLSKDEFKQQVKRQKQEKKLKEKNLQKTQRIFVIDFIGDMRASAVSSLRNAITAVLTVANENDEIVVCLESSGGLVHAYGLAASQLERVKQLGISLTVIIDKVAASGGYLMACVADKILAAPFAIIGSIGVVAQLPNFHRLLKKNHIDFEQMTAGEFKRTLTMFGENTEKARQKFQQELEEIHHIFKHFILRNRPLVDIDMVATGEHWLASQAVELKLVDGLTTSDDYLLQASEKAELYKVSLEEKKALHERLMSGVESLFKPIY